jgi:hypothetical protein
MLSGGTTILTILVLIILNTMLIQNYQMVAVWKSISTLDSTVDGNEDWVVEFWRDRSLGITGAGDQQRVFATVLTAIGQFIEMKQPETLRFTADKDVEPGQKPMSRSNLYDRLVQRYAQVWGYRLDRSDMADTTIYALHRIR